MGKQEVTSSAAKVDAIGIKEIALEAGVDVRSVRKFLAGESVRGMAGARIQRAIAARNGSR